MSMTLADLIRTAINFLDQRARRQPAGPGAESHCSTQFFDTDEIAQFKNDRMRRLEIKLGRISVFQLTNVTRILDTGSLHSQTNTEKRRACLARVVNRANHSRNAAFA